MQKKSSREQKTNDQEPSFWDLLSPLFEFVDSLFHIRNDTDENGTIESIKRGVNFSGSALWILIFAIFIASIGLNINSTAVIIGAMLISPLMGPIMGAGLALGIYDFELLKKSLRNLAVMTLLSLFTSAIYFLISPLSDAQSELLARTSPTIYDVLIAFIGGATGIVAGSRKDKISNAIPGVAIATALMPPLCTAGYGLANWNLKFFFGAFYLYLINSVFIGISTLIFVRYLKFTRTVYTDPAVDKKIYRYVYLVSICLILPSLYFAYDIVVDSSFKRNAKNYLENHFTFEKSKILSANVVRKSGEKKIEVTIVGEALSEDVLSQLKTLLPKYGLEGTELKIIQSGSAEHKNPGNLSLETGVGSKNQEEKIQLLENELRTLKDKDHLVQSVAKEINVLFPSVESFSFGDFLVQNVQNFTSSKEVTILVKWKRPIADVEKKRLELFLKLRIGVENLKILDL
ncbi:DUF389 domain-containing protein [Leptospira santarosai]|uniref:PF04087 domain protein n=1 Tax=Leptospira santarosai serovar Shermani str. LT 821 TaxID=758847 RepID=K8Y7S9_9LEPT|nr:DUF389 domain-containing protein [Leptospira santarosai]EKT85820.1 hypothetical protein LSS_15546 [Leptospira santarosai serovar Shermani str. LT 821]EPG81670.1 PF04087 domain protein [Leptospira santarosai serovar Shermani str. 1342KT]